MGGRSAILNAGTWWLLGVALALTASLSHNPVLLGAIILASLAVVLTFAPRDRATSTIRIYGIMALIVVALRLVFRIVFNYPSLTNVALPLPTVSVHFGKFSFSYLGPVSWANLHAALIDGLHLAAIILAVAMANAVANPRKLLRSAPTALFEFATAAAVALNLAPQLISSLFRVRRARALRGASAGLSSLGGLIVPVIEDAINKSLDLAASMDARGFGRRGTQKRSVVAVSRAAIALALVLMAAGTYLILATRVSLLLALGMMAIAVASIAVSMRLSSIHQVRTRLITEPRTWRDLAVRAVAVTGLVAVAAAQLPNDSLLRWLQ